MPRLARLAACSLLAAVPSVSMHAQPQPPRSISPGSRVRLTAPALGLLREVGRVESVAADSLVLLRDRDSTSVRVGAASVRSLEVSRGKRRHTAVGILAGYAIMFALGFAGHPGMAHTDTDPSLEAIGYGIVYGTPVALLGGIIGSQIRSERWMRADWPGGNAIRSP